jgi:hypothetical protein
VFDGEYTGTATTPNFGRFSNCLYNMYSIMTIAASQATIHTYRDGHRTRYFIRRQSSRSIRGQSIRPEGYRHRRKQSICTRVEL